MPGYAPERHGYVRGYFLRCGSDYRFRVTDGLHRAVILAVSGPRAIRVRFNPRAARLVDVADVDNWPQVGSGDLPPAVARAFLLIYFTQDGRQKARNLGLS